MGRDGDIYGYSDFPEETLLHLNFSRASVAEETHLIQDAEIILGNNL